MIQTLFAWVLVGAVILSAYPWSAWLLARSPQPVTLWLPWLLTLALSSGTLALVMFCESLLGIRFTTWGITLVYAALMLPGWALWWRMPSRAERAGPLAVAEKLALALLLTISAAVMFNAVYWPFYLDDAVNIYHHFASEMTQSRAVVPLPGADTLYEAYPILIPLQYTYVYIVSGWENEYLARVIPALLSLGCIPAVYTLGRVLHDRRAGWAGALLLAFSPALWRWASSGYVDLPMAFFYTLAAIFAWRLWQDDSGTDAALMGVLVGLAAWTKNAALLAVGFMALWLMWGVLWRRIGWRRAGWALLACALIAAPWYVRNWLGAGLIIPATAWTEQAERSLATLLIFVTRPEVYGLPGVVILLSVLTGLVVMVRRRFDAPPYVLLLVWSLPFFAAWWLFVSYDPRFLLLFLPLLCVLAGMWLGDVWGLMPQRWRRYAVVLLVIVALALTAQAVWRSVEYKRAILQNPFMDDVSRHEVVSRKR